MVAAASALEAFPLYRTTYVCPVPVAAAPAPGTVNASPATTAQQTTTVSRVNVRRNTSVLLSLATSGARVETISSLPNRQIGHQARQLRRSECISRPAVED